MSRTLGGRTAYGYSAVTPSDDSANNFARPTRGLYVGGTGNVQAVRTDGTVVAFTAVQAGTLLPIACVRVNSTSTTATNMTALFN